MHKRATRTTYLLAHVFQSLRVRRQKRGFVQTSKGELDDEDHDLDDDEGEGDGPPGELRANIHVQGLKEVFVPCGLPINKL